MLPSCLLTDSIDRLQEILMRLQDKQAPETTDLEECLTMLRQTEQHWQTTEQSYQESEERVQLAQQAAHTGIWDWYIIENRWVWSSEFCNLHGLDRHTQPSYENWLNRIHPDDQKAVNQATLAALKCNTKLDVEYRILRGEEIQWLNAIAQIQQDAVGNPARLVGMTFDITRRKQAEEILQKSEKRFRRLSDSNIFGVAFGNFTADIFDANDYFLNMVGYTRSELEAGQIRWLEMTPPEYLPLDLQAGEELRRCGVAPPFEKEYIRKDGTRVPVLLGSALLDEPYEQQDTIVCFYLDLTKLKQAQIGLQLYADIVHNTQVGIVVWQLQNKDDPGSFRLIAANPAAQEATGVDFENLIGCTMAERFPNVVRSSIVHQYINVIESGQAQDLQDIYFKDDGFDGIFAVKAFPLPNQSVGLAFENVTRQRETEAALQVSRERLALVLESAQLGLWYCDLPLSNLIWNDRCKEHFWLSPETNVDINLFFEQIHPDDRDHTRTAIEESIASRSGYNIDYRTVSSDGKIRWIQAIGRTFCDQNGTPYRFDGITIDNTQRKLTETALKESAARLNIALTAAKMGDWSWNAITDLITFSDRATEIFGIASGSHLTWKQVLELVHPADRDRTQLAVEQAIAEQNDYSIEYRIIRPDSTQIWVAAMGRAYQDGNGEVLGMHGVVQDITSRKQAEESLRQANIQLESALLAGSVYTWRWSITDNRLFGNTALAHLFAVDPGEAGDGLPIEVFINAIHPDDRAGVFAKINQAIGTGEEYIAEYRVYTATGEERWVMARGMVEYDDAGNPIAFPGALADITERKQSEEALRQALQKLTFHVENTPMAVIEWDGELRITRWAGAAAQIFGWQSSEVLGRLLSDLNIVFEADVQEVAEVVNRLVVGEEAYILSYNRNYTKHGDVVHCEWYNSRLRDDSGQMLSVLSLVLDVTDKKQAAAERDRLLLQERAAREEAEQANRIKDEFLAVLSHELRSPLNPILGWANLLRNGTLDEKRTAYALETIERNAKLQTQLIEDLLDVSRILQSKLSLNLAPVDLPEIMQSALETVSMAAAAKSIEIQTLLDPTVGQVLGDPTRLQQIIWNLLTNAVKFNSMGGQVIIRLCRSGSYAQIQVSDTGRGISATFLPHVFEYFRQEDSTTTRKFGGLGLGLAIVRHLVELHGGTIQVDSPGEGQGATFTVRLPLLHQINEEL